MESLAGRLLVATPALESEPFHRSVIYLLHHDGEGAHGVIINRPTHADVDVVLPGWSDVATEPQVVFEGGPVGLDTALGLVSLPGDGEEPEGVRRLFGSVALVDLDTDPADVARHLAGVRVFAGYSGWGAGQLDLEVAEGGWYVVDAEPRDPFDAAPTGLWARVLRRQHDRLALVATYPEDPEDN